MTCMKNLSRHMSLKELTSMKIQRGKIDDAQLNIFFRNTQTKSYIEMYTYK